MSKFFVKNTQINEQKINIIGEDVNHIKNVLRLKVNEKIKICDIDTKINYLCNIDEILSNSILCSIEQKLEDNTESNLYINIFQGIPKGDKMEWIIEKCTEIGVSEFTPLKMERCVVKINDDKTKEKKLIRWKNKAESAAKQSGRDIIPEIKNIIEFNELQEYIKDYDLVIVAYENEKDNTIKNELKKLNKKQNKIAVIIGPEGRNK